MAFVFQERYEPHIEERMRAFWQTLSERDRRRFAARQHRFDRHRNRRAIGRPIEAAAARNLAISMK